jgi:hypothetical protein
MTPWQIAKDKWDKDCSAKEGSFDGQMAWHFAKGVVISTPDFFALLHAEHDAWFCTMAAATRPGWLGKLMNFIGPKEFVKWRRNGDRRVKQYRWEQLQRRA